MYGKKKAVLLEVTDFVTHEPFKNCFNRYLPSKWFQWYIAFNTLKQNTQLGFMYWEQKTQSAQRNETRVKVLWLTFEENRIDEWWSDGERLNKFAKLQPCTINSNARDYLIFKNLLWGGTRVPRVNHQPLPSYWHLFCIQIAHHNNDNWSLNNTGHKDNFNSSHQEFRNNKSVRIWKQQVLSQVSAQILDAWNKCDGKAKKQHTSQETPLFHLHTEKKLDKQYI